MRRLLALLIVALQLTACSTPDPAQTLPALTFEHLAPIRIEAQSLQVDRSYRPPLDQSHVEATAPVSPAEALATWAEDRIQAVGGSGMLRFNIIEGSLVEEPLSVEKGLMDVFKNQQAFRYTVVVEGELELAGAPGIRRIAAAARAERSTTVPEDATLNERDRALFELVEKVMAAYDRQMEDSVRRYFGNYLR